MYSEDNSRLLSSNPVTTKIKKRRTIFQQAIEEVLKGLDVCVAYQDDFLLFDVTEAELRKRYNAVKERLAAKTVIVNEDKCVSISTTVSFFGNEVSSEGVKPEQKHVQKLIECNHRRMLKKLKLLSDVLSTLDYAAKTRCINELRKKNKLFKWTDKCQKAFQSLVDELTSEPLVQSYKLDKSDSHNGCI